LGPLVSTWNSTEPRFQAPVLGRGGLQCASAMPLRPFDINYNASQKHALELSRRGQWPTRTGRYLQSARATKTSAHLIQQVPQGCVCARTPNACKRTKDTHQAQISIELNKAYHESNKKTQRLRMVQTSPSQVLASEGHFRGGWYSIPYTMGTSSQRHGV
jgi:hypothetical protein